MASTEIARSEGHNLTDRMQYAKALASASLLPKQYQQNPGNVLLAMELGDALGIRPIQAINSVHVIEGKPSASSDLIASLIRKAGHKLRVTGDDASATAQIIRADDPDFTFEATWTMDRAKAAGLSGKGVWKSYPAAMLKARAITEVARAGASDALYGVIYTPEELGAEVNGSGEPAQRRAPVPEFVAEPVATVTMSRKRPAPEPVEYVAEVVEPTPQTDDGGGSLADTSVAEGAAGSIPASNTPPSSDLIDPKGKQMKAIHAGMNDAGLGERTAGLAFLTEMLGREVTTSKDLTRAEAGRVLDQLTEITVGVTPEPEWV